MTFETEPLEEAGLRRGAGDKGGDELPAFADIVDFGDGESLSVAVLADEPDEDLEIADAPVAFQFVGLGHPNSSQSYFSIRFYVY